MDLEHDGGLSPQYASDELLQRENERRLALGTVLELRSEVDRLQTRNEQLEAAMSIVELRDRAEKAEARVAELTDAVDVQRTRADALASRLADERADVVAWLRWQLFGLSGEKEIIASYIEAGEHVGAAVGETGWCSACRRNSDHPHADDCIVARALAKARGER